MKDNLNWVSFSECYHLKNDKYVNDIALLRRLQSEFQYPIILYPKRLNEQLRKSFAIGSIGVLLKDRTHIYLHDFLGIAKSLKLKGNNWEFLIHPFNPKDASEPNMPKIPTEVTETYKTRNWGCLVPFLLVAFLFTLPAFFISPDDLGLAIIVALLWIPFILLMGYKAGVGKEETKSRIRRLSQNEIDELTKNAQIKYQHDLISYRKLKKEYDNKLIEYNQNLNLQAKLLDKYANLIVPTIFKRILITYPQLKDCENPPQRGKSEDMLFYSLMKELPSYVKMDKVLGNYAPDLILHNGCSCPIDLEIDEPYELRTKKEIHYIGCGDEERNNFFTSNDWFVLRFSENQIKSHLNECLKIVKALVYFIEWGDTSQLREIEDILNDIKEPRWTKEQARMLAIDNYRGF